MGRLELKMALIGHRKRTRLGSQSEDGMESRIAATVDPGHTEIGSNERVANK